MPPYTEIAIAGEHAHFRKFPRAEAQDAVYKIVHCPSTDSTYEGHIVTSVSSSQLVPNDTGRPFAKRDKKKQPTAHYIKHGKGLLHDYSAGMTLDGYFQNDEVIGHALQTLYDKSGRHIIAQYEGGFVLDITYVRHGKGKYTWQKTNDVYSGDFSMGAMQGLGTFVWGNGDRYEGPFKMGLPWGSNGKKTNGATGDIFEGSFKKGRMHGWGRKDFGNGDVFCGLYSRDVRKGFGRYAWNSGDVYVGNWENGNTTGRGVKSIVASSSDAVQTPTHGTSEVYNGEWDTDEACGSGVKHYACGDVYYGDFENNLRHGHGIYTWSNGDYYEGGFAAGSCSGQGMKFMVNGDVYNGAFSQDKANGYGVKTYANGDAHMGYYHNDERHGPGQMSWANGDCYDGYFEDGEQSGIGEKRWRNLSIYRGQWHKGKKSGPGFMKAHVNGIDFVFFDVWKGGTRVSREVAGTDWYHVPAPSNMMNKNKCLQELLNHHWISQI